MIDTDKYENMRQLFLDFIDTASDEVDEEAWKDKLTMLDELLAEVKRLQSEPTVTVDDYHKKGHLYITVYFPDGEQYVGLVEKWEGEEE
tara:strand:- start:511 stop:777 length:267 start_codon:yes stop_codon:yes gene_type:complete